ncbi:MAG: S-methyl-5-thioribose-1-phosphate isomerase [Firmicutes bacterium]|nr:S-methyl-5-thioribose-1-phosphate isomerase [Bacillota bacterium]
MNSATRSLRWEVGKGCLVLLDQTRLPAEERYVECRTHSDVIQGIKGMIVRGAPAIGAAAAYGVVLAALEFGGDKEGQENLESFRAHLEAAAGALRVARPTAVNLRWAVDRMMRRADDEIRRAHEGDGGVRRCGGVDRSIIENIKHRLLEEANSISSEDIAVNRSIGEVGRDLIPPGARIMTYCNAGALATVDYGTALGVIRCAQAAGRNVRVYACETRPLLQGARLTSWELTRDNIPVTLITDNMAGYVMKEGLVDLVIVGADRVAANGDVANKIGTYTLAVLARENKVPFYVAAPISTIDLSLPDGSQIPIEFRSADEVTTIGCQRIAPEGVDVLNPAFDVTPHEFVTAIITERGLVREPYGVNLKIVAA